MANSESISRSLSDQPAVVSGRCTTHEAWRGWDLIDVAPWPERLLVLALIRSPAARARFLSLGIPPTVLVEIPEAVTIAAHALSEHVDVPDPVHAALDHRCPGHRTWRETLETTGGWPDEWHVRDVDRCCVTLAVRWLPAHLRWVLAGLEAGDISRLAVLFDLSDLIRRAHDERGVA